MTELGPWMITARSKEQAEYLIRSRAEQRGLHLTALTVSDGASGMWQVSATVSDSAETAAAARLGDDTKVLHLDIHPRIAR
jgi:hypothetical protein